MIHWLTVSTTLLASGSVEIPVGMSEVEMGSFAYAVVANKQIVTANTKRAKIFFVNMICSLESMRLG